MRRDAVLIVIICMILFTYVVGMTDEERERERRRQERLARLNPTFQETMTNSGNRRQREEFTPQMNLNTNQLTNAGFTQSQGNFYYPQQGHPHLHVITNGVTGNNVGVTKVMKTYHTDRRNDNLPFNNGKFRPNGVDMPADWRDALHNSGLSRRSTPEASSSRHPRSPNRRSASPRRENYRPRRERTPVHRRRSPTPPRLAPRNSFGPPRRRSPSPPRRDRRRRSPSPPRRDRRRSPSPSRQRSRRSPSAPRHRARSPDRSARRSSPRGRTRSRTPPGNSRRRTPSPPRRKLFKRRTPSRSPPPGKSSKLRW
jgi:hypothetical protein